MTATTSPEKAASPTWVRCTRCGASVYHRRLARELQVCPECGHHRRLGARERIAQLVDDASFVDAPSRPTADDPLGFIDSVRYVDRLAAARATTGEHDAVVVGTATVESHPAVLAVMDFAFMGGSMGVAVGEAVASAADLAMERGLPLVVVTASGGARMQEGVLSLLQMTRTAHAMALLREAGLLSVCVLTDPTFGGVTASFASLGDVLVAEQEALVGFAGPRVIAQTVREELPDGFQGAASLLANGLVDRVEPRERLRPLLGRLLALAHGEVAPAPDAAPARGAVATPGDATARGSGAATTPDGRPVGEESPSTDARPDPWQVVQRARDPQRPTALDQLAGFDDFVELHGDRAQRDDPAVVGGLAALGGRTVMALAHQKGHETRELVAHSFGMPHPEGYRKAMRLMRLAERLGVPVVTLVDTPGAYPGVAAEQGGQSVTIAESIATSSRLRVPVVSVVTGEGGSGGALALATADRLLVCENAFFSVISPEGCAAILWRSAEAAPHAARALRLTAPDLLALGVADEVVAEPRGGAQSDPEAATATVRRAIAASLDELCALDTGELLARRRARHRAAGSRPGLVEPSFPDPQGPHGPLDHLSPGSSS